MRSMLIIKLINHIRLFIKCENFDACELIFSVIFSPIYASFSIFSEIKIFQYLATYTFLKQANIYVKF